MWNIRSVNGPASVSSAHTHRPRSSRHAKVVCTVCPYRTLGVTATADDKEIKKAYRQLALKYHPDVSKAEDTERKFISIQEAYYILTGKARGKEALSSRSAEGQSWDFHDWIWQFRMNRSWDRQRSASPLGAADPAAFRPEETKEAVQTQLAGLRHRAAVRRVQKMNASWSEEDDEPEATRSTSSHPAASAGGAAPDMSFTEAADVSDGANYTSAAPGSGEQGRQQQAPKFHMGEERRTHVSSQLAGLKRKGVLKQQRQRA